ncbi:MAG TPA: helix-hairpin-helix domain-containing protein [Gemmatimonadaceae bacterium]|nr:helix-hairpin-helix domain-containing protein [Gemmatimonadaceae bacterium]
MPTPAERKALIFLSGLLVLGTGVRMRRADARTPAPSPAAVRALDRQIAAVDSARKKARAKKHTRTRSSRVVVRASAGSDALPRTRQPVIIGRRPVLGFSSNATIAQGGTSAARIDLDRATEAEIERLPRIGPVLARRIVDDRTRLGPFGSLKALQRVKGIGPALARKLAPYVTFSLQPRPSGVTDRAQPPRSRRRRRPSRSGAG